MSSKEDSDKKLIDEIINKLGEYEKVKVIWQNAGDPYKRMWSLNEDEFRVAFEYQSEKKAYIPNRNTDKINKFS